MVNDYPKIRYKEKGNIQNQPSGPNSETPKINRSYELKARGEQESFPDVVTGMLEVLSVIVYAFLYPSATLSLVTPFLGRKFVVLPDVLIEPLLICTPMGYSVIAKRLLEMSSSAYQ